MHVSKHVTEFSLLKKHKENVKNDQELNKKIAMIITKKEKSNLTITTTI